ncbi:hypothetical protein [Haloarcula salinisoli]|uniref:Uncharacterized protein n=1 Tax=Haloarcula salinisoli TaxID=2487746 RepID=A0A8J7YNC1_9EURY|nr:hypothetical protein [Halomicroarcula salinisoli]MBX0287502.1 hypothetical protein [Halomicroarcula salinisoli]MBX0304926.1 hypothetical protein [Halomicroarcula salinisoli]
MSIAIGHFVVGAALTTVVVTLFVPGVSYPRTIVLAGGGWAMGPDFHQVSPVAREALFEFHSSPWADLFWFHRTLDTLDATDSNTVAAVLLSGFILTTLVAERRSYRTPTVVVDTYETYLDVETDQ